MRKTQFQLRLFQFIFFVMLCQIGFAQSPPPLRENYTYNNWRKAIARWQINSLADGVLLVRLKTNQSAIDQLRAAGNDKYADKIETRQTELNEGLIKAFREQFDFCDVYFFTSNYSDLVRAHKLDSIPFVAKHVVNPDSQIDASTSFLVAEFGTLQADTTSMKDRFQTEDSNTGNTVTYSTNSNLGVPALIFKSDQIVQLNEPFPYYVRTYKSIDFLVDKPLSRVIEKANERLHVFYGRPTVDARQKNEFKVARRQDYQNSDLNKYRLALNGGYTVRLADEIRTQGSNDSYEKSLKNGYGFGMDLDYFFTRHIGVGVAYQFSHFSVEDGDQNLEEDMLFHYVGPKFTARVPNNKNVYLASVGIGYSWFRDNIQDDGVDWWIKGESFALAMDLGYDFNLSPTLAMGLQIGLKTGSLSEIESKFPNERAQTTSLTGDSENLIRFEVKAGIRFK